VGGVNVDMTLAKEHKIALLSVLGYTASQISKQLGIQTKEINTFLNSEEGQELLQIYQQEFKDSDLNNLRNDPDMLDLWIRSHLMNLLDSIDGAVSFLNDTLNKYTDNPGLVLEGLRVYSNLVNVYRQVAHDIHLMIIDNVKLQLSKEKHELQKIKQGDIVVDPEEVSQVVSQVLSESKGELE